MLRCATSFVIAAYVHVRIIPQDFRALSQPAPAKAGGDFYEAIPFSRFLPLFTRASILDPDRLLVTGRRQEIHIDNQSDTLILHVPSDKLLSQTSDRLTPRSAVFLFVIHPFPDCLKLPAGISYNRKKERGDQKP
jgi:hypothetical protein